MDLEPNEEKQGSWILNLLLNNSRYNGNLIITNQNVYYNINYNFGDIGAISKEDGGIKFSRADIANVEAYTQYWVFQRLKVTLKDGAEYVFDRGVMPVGGILKLLK